MATGLATPLLHDEHDPTVILGTNGPDLIVTGGGPQSILGGNGDDTILAGGGPDTIHCANGSDRAEGGGGPDLLAGGNGKDELLGGAGPDALVGGNGRDVLTGGLAADVLTGGRGADVFVYMARQDAAAHGEEGGHDGGEIDHEEASVESITDFQPGLDHIDLSALGVVQGFSDDLAAYAVWAVQQGEDAVLMIDLDGDIMGDHPAEMSIHLLGVDAAALGGSDFIL